MPTYSDWYTDTVVTAAFAERTNLRTGRELYLSKSYPDTTGNIGTPTHEGLVEAFEAMEAVTETIFHDDVFQLDDLDENGRGSVGGRGYEFSSLSKYGANRTDKIMAWRTDGRSLYDYIDLVSDLPGYVEGAELEVNESESATVIGVTGHAERYGAYYISTTDGDLHYGHFGVTHATSPEITWQTDGSFDADPADNIILNNPDASTTDEITDFPWDSLISPDGKTVSVGGVVESYTVPAEAARSFSFGSPFVAVEAVTVILPPYRWYGDVPPPAPTAIPRVLRNYPRDDGHGFGGPRRNYPPPRGRRNIGGQP